MSAEEEILLLISAGQIPYMINVKEMKQGKLYRITADTIFWDASNSKGHRFVQNNIVMFLGYRIRHRPGQLVNMVIEAQFVFEDRTIWVRVGNISVSDYKSLPSDILESNYIIPCLELAKPSPLSCASS